MSINWRAVLLALLIGPTTVPMRSSEIGRGQLDSVANAILQMQSQNMEERAKALRTLVQHGTRATVPLVEALLDKNVLVRAGAADALGFIGDPAALDGLTNALTDVDEGVRVLAAKSLGKLKDTRAVPNLVKTLTSDEDWRVRMFAARSLGQLRDESAIDPLLQVVEDGTRSDDERGVAVVALGALRASAGQQAMLHILEDRNAGTDIRAAAAAALGNFTDGAVTQALLGHLRDAAQKIRYNVVVALGRQRIGAAVGPLLAVFRNPDEVEAIRIAAAASVGSIGGELATVGLIEDLSQSDEYLAMHAAKALARIGDRRALAPTEAFLAKAHDPYVRKQLVEVVTALSK